MQLKQTLYNSGEWAIPNSLQTEAFCLLLIKFASVIKGHLLTDWTLLVVTFNITLSIIYFKAFEKQSSRRSTYRNRSRETDQLKVGLSFHQSAHEGPLQTEACTYTYAHVRTAVHGEAPYAHVYSDAYACISCGLWRCFILEVGAALCSTR